MGKRKEADRLTIPRAVGRYPQLDSLRGLAALSVFFGHCVNMLPEANRGPLLSAVTFTPLHIVWAGRQAVIFFFVLSGFVLALPFCAGSSPVMPFLIRRVCRLWPPYLAALGVAAVLWVLVPRHPMPAWSGEFNVFWSQPVRPGELLSYLSLLGPVRWQELNPVLWSLVLEMRISLVFPLLMGVVMRLRWWQALGPWLILCPAAALMSSAQADGWATLTYAWCFVLGAVLARHRAGLVAWLEGQPGPALACLLLFAVLIYVRPFWLFAAHPLYPDALDDVVSSIGAAGFILLAVAWRSLGQVLQVKPLLALGKMAYSVYLFHILVLLTLAHLWYGRAPIWMIWLAALAGTLVVSAASYRFVELAGIALGRRLTARLSAAPPSTWFARPAA